MPAQKPLDNLLNTYKKSSPAGSITQKKKTKKGDVLPVFDSDILDKATVDQQIEVIEAEKDKNRIYTDPNYKVDKGDETKYIDKFTNNNVNIKKRFGDFSDVISKLDNLPIALPLAVDN